MRSRLTTAITMGLGLAGCGDRPISDSSGAGTEGSSAGTGSESATVATEGSASMTSQGTSASTQSDATAASSDGDDEGVIYDVGIDLDVGVTPIECYDDEPPFAVGAECEIIDFWVTICAPAEGSGCLAPDDFEIVTLLEQCAGVRNEGCVGLGESCGPVFSEAGACCYWGQLTQTCPGRPFTIDGRARLAPVMRRDDWCDAWPMGERDEALARAWLFDARHEHAAVASFSRFTLQLLAMGAPARFVDAAVQAARDEREHATLFFGLARAHGHGASGPGALDVSGAMAGADDSIAVVVATVREGCVAEAISAMQLVRAQAHAQDGALKDALARVLEQELAHVELAWAFVAWAYARGDAALRAAVEAAFRDAALWIPVGAGIEGEDLGRWRRAGRLGMAEESAIALETIRGIVLPAARELFSRAGMGAGTGAGTEPGDLKNALRSSGPG